jgi:hypothetical protein
MSETTPNEARVFPVETRFQQMARRNGGVPRDSAIEAAVAKLDEIKPSFEAWLEQKLQTLAEVIAGAQTKPPAPDWVSAAASHSRQLRDIGTTMDFELLTFIADSLCDVLDAIAEGSDCNMESVTCHLDALILARQPQYRHMKPGQVPELTGGLRRVVEHISTAPT